MPPEPERAGGVEAVGAIIRKPTPGSVIVAAALLAAVTLAWWWLASRGAGSGPAMASMRAGNVWTAGYLGAALAMWALMMIAMMLPSAAPMILLYERLVRRGVPGNALARTAVFALAYVAIWTLFSVAAAVAQATLISSGIVSEMALRIGNGRIAGALLLLAGIYQLSPLKRACLESCRSPLSFLMRLWRPGPAGALRLGLAHGFYCLGCCWALMLLLFVGGVMSLAWIAGLAILVFLEKLMPASLRASKVICIALLVAGSLLLLSVPKPADPGVHNAWKADAHSSIAGSGTNAAR